jgi:lysophospholipase L1-like esterase
VLLPLIVALGDSLTSGYGLPSPSSQNYAALYARRVHGNLVNLAVPGSQCDDVANNQVPKLPRGAAIVILNCGSNDIGGFGFTPEGKPDGTKRTAPANDAELATAERTFAGTLARIRTMEPQATIYLVNLRHWQRMTGAESAQFAKDVDTWNAMLAKSGLHVVDIAGDPRMYRQAYVLPDILHLSAEGNAAIASEFPIWTQNDSRQPSMQPSKPHSFPTAKRAQLRAKSPPSIGLQRRR